VKRDHLSALHLIFRLILLTALFAANAAFAQTPLEKMNVGYSAQAGAYAPIWITKDASLFRKNGLDVNLIFIPGGPTAAAAMIAGEVQAMAMAGPAIVTSNLAGSDLVMTAGIVNTFAFQFVTVKGITSPNQLKGKRIGINRFGAAPDVAARFALRHMGIDAREVTILQLGEQSTRLEAMKAGQLDAAILLPPITTIAQKEGMNVLMDMSELGAEFQITGLASSQSFITQKRASALKLMRAFVEGIHYFNHAHRRHGGCGRDLRLLCRQDHPAKALPVGQRNQGSARSGGQRAPRSGQGFAGALYQRNSAKRTG